MAQPDPATAKVGIALRHLAGLAVLADWASRWSDCRAAVSLTSTGVLISQRVSARFGIRIEPVPGIARYRAALLIQEEEARWLDLLAIDRALRIPGSLCLITSRLEQVADLPTLPAFPIEIALEGAASMLSFAAPGSSMAIRRLWRESPKIWHVESGTPVKIVRAMEGRKDGHGWVTAREAMPSIAFEDILNRRLRAAEPPVKPNFTNPGIPMDSLKQFVQQESPRNIYTDG